MRILLVSKYLHFPQGGGGLERNTHELCLRLVRAGVQPAVMCDLHPDRSLLAFKNRVARKLRPSIRFPVDHGCGYPVYRGWGENDGAKEVTARFKPDVVIAQSAEPVPLLRSFEGLGVPRMAYFHEVERVEDAREVARMGDVGFLANSVFTAAQIMQAADVAPPPVIRPLIDPELYRTRRSPSNVLYVNTHPRKGVEVAFAIAQARPDVHFDFVCYWTESAESRRRLQERAQAAGNITLHPPTNDMRPLYGRARLLLAPSQWREAWGRVATEAQVNGIPVLASARGGLPESVGPGGLLVEHDAPLEAWLAAFSEIWDDPVRYERYSTEAKRHSLRPEIQPDQVVREFITEVRAFSNRGAQSTRGAPE
jgi:glycosyltransferase involved in cell wall biosynthesis